VFNKTNELRLYCIWIAMDLRRNIDMCSLNIYYTVKVRKFVIEKRSVWPNRCSKIFKSDFQAHHLDIDELKRMDLTVEEFYIKLYERERWTYDMKSYNLKKTHRRSCRVRTLWTILIVYELGLCVTSVPWRFGTKRYSLTFWLAVVRVKCHLLHGAPSVFDFGELSKIYIYAFISYQHMCLLYI